MVGIFIKIPTIIKIMYNSYLYRILYQMIKKPLILIVCDELVYMDKLNPEYLNQLTGIQKFLNKMISLPYHYTNSTPCSAARSVLYTGQHINKTKITENIETSWQESLKDKAPLIQTLGNYFKLNEFKTNYKGKFHLAKNLVPTIPITYKPLIATQTYLETFGFDEFEKFGDFCFDRRLGTFNDELVVEQKLPIGNTPNNCDYWDPETGYGYDGVIPFFKGSKSNDLFALVVNFDNPHDIKNANVQNNISTLNNVTTQIIGYNSTSVPSISDYNSNFKLFSEIPLFLTKSFVLNNCFDSKTNSNSNPNNCGIVSEIALKYLFYGTEYFNESQAQQYQTAYYRILKQVDMNLTKLFDYFESNGIFDNCVVCLTSDHGDYIGSHGLYQKAAPIYDPGYHVPLMLSWPKMSKSDIIVPPNIITSHINLLPTLLSLCGINPLKFDNLASSIVNSDGNIILQDYNVVKLSLSILFGPFLLPSLKNLKLPEVNKLIRCKTSGSNYLTLQAFSVSSIIEYQHNVYNCGYYFSLLDVFVDTVKYWGFSLYKHYILDKQIYILVDEMYEIGFVGLKSNLILFLQTNLWASDKLTKFNIEPYNNTNLYVYEYNSTYNIKIVGKNENANLNLAKLNQIYSYKFEFTNQLVYICNNFGDEIIGYFPDINFIIGNNLVPENYDLDNIKIYTDLIDMTNMYIYPFYSDNKLYIKTNNYSNYQKFILNTHDIFYNKIFNQLDTKSIGNYYQTNNFFIVLVIDYLIKLNDKLILPGVGLNIFELTNKFYTEIFNITMDPNEIVNLADKSRFNNFAKLTNNLLTILYVNIDKNNLRQIFISLPSQYYISTQMSNQELS
jgi:arylsulfatase A-like enzyme